MTSLDTSAPESAQNTPETAATTFADLGLPAPLLRAVLDLGFTVPSSIQERAIPALLSGSDITGVAQTGTGKTAAFGLPMLAAIDPSVRQTQALVLTPTRELAMQVAEAIETFAKHMDGLEVVPVYGGSPYQPQVRSLSRGAQVVVGTPGRVIDHLERGTLKLDGIRFLVLDEADEMLRMGFAEDVEKVFGMAPTERQVALFSATMPPQIRRVAQHHLRQPVEISVSRQSSTVTAVTQQFAVVPFRHKIGSLVRVLATSDAEAAIVFCRTRGAAEEVGSALIERGISAATISGDVAQKDREKIVERLRAGALDVLVATDVAARGLDVDRLGLVVNFDIPGEPEAYVHRIGRTGRAGRTGVALSFVTPSERGRLKSIERTIRQQLTEIEIPSPADVSAYKVRQLLGKVTERHEAGRLSMYQELVREHLDTHGTDPVELAAVLAALAVGDDGPKAREEEALFEAQRAEARETRRRDERAPRREGDSGRPQRSGIRRDAVGTRYRLSVGHTHGAQPSGIVGALTNEGGLSGKDLGKIDIFPSFSLVDIVKPLDEATIDRISRARVAGKALRIKLDDGPAPRGANAGGHSAPGGRPRNSAPAGRREAGFDRQGAGAERKPRFRTGS
ncbi:DEAD/DEAH box helicase [Sanguibacter suaedae]|uniref:RNA helicase n=1 Tax=Sanguibacter suaedae TaxID=2795737 RepID=A0A934M7G9_9MICO|nr:DEAD/DEAH box helicase [Sanguibacter suaedae]MBI9115392.1 DEAD/DEAH box helicase [Sanguibacter suaedae]